MGSWDMIRRTAAWMESLEERVEQARPGLRQASYEYARRLQNGWDSLRGVGLEQANQLESGHYLYFAAPGAHPHSGDNGEWQMWVHHASEADHPEQRMVYARLGPDDSAIGEHAMRHLRNPRVLRSMQEQMTPGPLDETWPRRF